MNTRILTLTLLLAAAPWVALAQANFTKITTGALVNDLSLSQGCAWGDLNNDGYIDLFVANYRPGSTTTNFLYQNNGDATFTKLTTNSIVTVLGNFSTGVWGDWDNDSLLDLYVVEYQGANSFYRNQGNGAFARIPASLTAMPPKPGDALGGASWGDYDNDGFPGFVRCDRRHQQRAVSQQRRWHIHRGRRQPRNQRGWRIHGGRVGRL